MTYLPIQIIIAGMGIWLQLESSISNFAYTQFKEPGVVQIKQ